MYFSYDQGSFANLYPLSAYEVREIIKMNRNGIRPESLKVDVEPHAPEFVTAVGDDSISRFDETKKKKKRNSRSRGGKGRGGRNKGEVKSDKGKDA
jgi:hypothetical protein